MVGAGDAAAMFVDGCRWFGRAQSKKKRVGDGRGRVVVQCVPFALMLPMFTSTPVESVDTPSQPNR